MPTVKVTANVVGVTPDAKVPLSYQWNVTLVFTGGACVHSLNRRITHPEINATTQTSTFTIPFSQIRGGDLTVSVSVQAGNVLLSARTEKLQVVGTNPSTGALLNLLIVSDAFKKLMRLESGLRQFRTPTCPLFSGDNLGGVGICQITSPRPTDDQVWSWRENLKAGLLFYKAKEGVARAYPRHVRESQAFKTLVKEYNDRRVAKGTPDKPIKPLTIDLPEYTPEQLERDTVRGYNGYAGGLHEYRVKVDGGGLLVVNADVAGSKGTAEWEVISAADRVAEYDKRNIPANHRGDPGYVDDVYNQASF